MTRSDLSQLEQHDVSDSFALLRLCASARPSRR